MATYKKSGTVYSRQYEPLGGVDFSGEGACSPERLCASENLWRDYEGDGDGALESVVGFRRLFDFGNPIGALYRQVTVDGDFVIVHAGQYLYRFPYAERDSRACVYLGRLSGTKSCGFAFGDRLFVLDGSFLSCVERTGFTAHVAEGNVDPYIPTTYRDGAPLEQRNMLTDQFVETYTVTLPEMMSYGTPGLAYEPDPDHEGAVRVAGIGQSAGGVVYIPSRVTYDGELCRVSGIRPRAFSDLVTLTELHIGAGVEYIGRFAFYGCTSLSTVTLPDSLTDIGAGAFMRCTALSTLYLGEGLASVGEDAFASVGGVKTVGYAGDYDRYTLIEGREALAQMNVEMGCRYDRYRLSIPVHSPAVSISSLSLAGRLCSFGTTTVNGLISEVYVDVEASLPLYAGEAVMRGTLTRQTSRGDGVSPSFIDAYPAFSSPLAMAIHRCTVATVFDGRVFLSGHPDLPGVVFYSGRTKDGVSDPTYFGIYNYFSDSLTDMPVTALLPVGSTLAVFKRDDDGDGSILYHTPTDTADPLVPRIYPVTGAHRGLGAIGAVTSFLDEAVFIGREGLCALEGPSLSGERSVSVRSRLVSARLLTEELSRIRLGRLSGYLVLSVDGRMYLADARRAFRRSGEVQYEWYLLNGIGSYTDAQTVYRYSSVSYGGLDVSDTPDVPVRGEILTKTESERTITYTLDGGREVGVYRTDEKTGGVFSAAEALLSIDGHLLFGTGAGSLCIFNTDRRGTPPDRLSEASDFDAELYRATYGRRFHPDDYTFDKHAPRYALALCADDVGLAHMSKSTVRHSLAVRLRTDGRPTVHVEVGTDRAGFRELGSLCVCPLAFDALDFGALSFDTGATVTLPLPERERGWVHKQIALYSDEFCSPIGVYSIGYRFTVDGRIKKF